jgi:predicted acetyltransferase
MSDEITLLRATSDDAERLSNLLELYMHDLSELFSIEVGTDGRFGYDHLERYWREPEQRFAHLIRVGAQLAGFALARRGSPLTDDPTDLDVAEFFVLRRHRRAGVGMRAAALLWDAIPGHWIVRVAGGNLRALAFWRAAVAAHQGQAPSERRVVLPEREWHVLDLRSPAGADAAG